MSYLPIGVQKVVQGLSDELHMGTHAVKDIVQNVPQPLLNIAQHKNQNPFRLVLQEIIMKGIGLLDASATIEFKAYKAGYEELQEVFQSKGSTSN